MSPPSVVPTTAGIGGLVATPPLVEPMRDLLRTIAEALDVREIFPGIAQITSLLLPLDCLDLVVLDPFGNVAFRTRSAHGFPDDPRASFVARADVCVVPDIREIASQDDGGEQRSFVESLAAAGYQSILAVRAKARERVIRLGFFSKHRAAYTHDDVPVARLIADAIAVVVSHQQLAEAQRTRLDARGQAAHLNSRVRLMAETREGQPDRSRDWAVTGVAAGAAKGRSGGPD